VGVASGEPFDVSGFELGRGGAAAFDVAAEVDVGDGDDEVRAVVVMAGDDASGLELDFGDAGVVFDEEDFLRAGVEDVEAAVFVPVGGGCGAGFFVLHEFDGDVAEGRVATILSDVSEVAGGEASVAIFQRQVNGGFALDFVGELRVAERDEEIVVAMTVHEGGIVRGDLDFEDADVFVLQGEVVVAFVGNLDFLRTLGGDEDGGEQEKCGSFHGAGL